MQGICLCFQGLAYPAAEPPVIPTRPIMQHATIDRPFLARIRGRSVQATAEMHAVIEGLHELEDLCGDLHLCRRLASIIEECEAVRGQLDDHAEFD